ncbi:anti-sigma factor [uncultured Microbacterium sp.]|uniref:anti-sigma factor n=1 Tax=uncultured Microbacterium sp. TaxID=191216 RepID=UPI0028D4C3E0|nr:anti-sigma factor [uncultured Microbacterium sp.]
MPHIDPERLALFAMGEPVATPEESEHLADCAVCVDDLAALRHVAIAGRASIDVGELEAPPDSVWSRIAEELSLGTKTREPEAAPLIVGEADTLTERREAEPVSVVDAAAPRRRVMRGIWALAASLVLVAGVGLGVWAVTQRAALTEVAEATLAPFPDHPSAAGTAVVEERPDGTKAVRVQLNADAAPDTFREVWLITADASALVSLGVLDGKDQTFAIPADVDLRDYVLVDVSQEPVDGDPTHSGDSIVRGELSFS